MVRVRFCPRIRGVFGALTLLFGILLPHMLTTGMTLEKMKLLDSHHG